MANYNEIEYIHIEPWMMKEAKLKGNDLLIFALIYSFSRNEGGICTMSYKGFADTLGTSESRIRATFKKLEELKYIKNTNTSGFHHSYIALISKATFINKGKTESEKPLESTIKTARIDRKKDKKPLESVPNTNNINTNINTKDVDKSWMEEDKPENPMITLRTYYFDKFKELQSTGKLNKNLILPNTDKEFGKIGAILKKILSRVSLEDAMRYIDYISTVDWIVVNKSFSLAYIFCDGIFTSKYNEMKSKQEEYVPPVKKIIQLPRCSKCGEEVSAVDGKCPWCRI